MKPDGARRNAAVIDLVDLVNLGHRVTAHSAVLLQVVWGHLATQSNERPGTDRPPRRRATGDARLGQCSRMSPSDLDVRCAEPNATCCRPPVLACASDAGMLLEGAGPALASTLRAGSDTCSYGYQQALLP